VPLSARYVSRFELHQNPPIGRHFLD